MKKVLFLIIILLQLCACKNDSMSYYNVESEQYIDKLETDIKHLKSNNDELQDDNINLEEERQELEDKLLEYE